MFLFRNIMSVNGCAILDHGGYTVSYYSDASDTGYAGYIEGQTLQTMQAQLKGHEVSCSGAVLHQINKCS